MEYIYVVRRYSSFGLFQIVSDTRYHSQCKESGIDLGKLRLGGENMSLRANP